MKELSLRESKAPYILTLDEESLIQEPVILQREGQPVAVILPFAEYEAYRVWQQAQQSSRAKIDAFEQERMAFVQMRPQLLQTHQGKVVAIYQKQIVEVGNDVGQTLMKVYERFGYIPCYVQRVEATEPVYHFPHRQVVR